MVLFSSICREEIFTAALQQGGWSVVSPDVLTAAASLSGKSIPNSLQVQTPGGDFSARVVFFQIPSDNLSGVDTLAFVDFMPTEKEPNPNELPAALFRKYLDLSRLERLVLWIAHHLPQPRFLLCATAEACSLFCVEDETLLGQCSASPNAEQVKLCLRALENRALDQIPLPDPERLSRELNRWLGLFCGTVGPTLRWSRHDAERLARHLLLGLKALLAVPADQRNASLECLGVTANPTDAALVLNCVQLTTSRLLEVLLTASANFAPLGTGAFSALEIKGLVRQINALEPLRQPPIAEIFRLANVRLQSRILLPLVAPAESMHASWKLAYTDPLRINAEMNEDDLYVFAPLTLELAECGFGRVLEALDRLAEHALKRAERLGQADFWQLDMFESAASAEGDDVLTNPLNWICRRALRLKATAEWREPLAFLTAAHLLEVRMRPEYAHFAPQSLPALPDLFKEA
ncbi:TPA: hypothetical protein DDW35_12815 [Candidatus Sumerlaeota bacterium]|jgi:hypothetical protein|nr:hypothetical protein [Candidatus Sumerlaeota bacterium]